uniref:Uncharacterized protein n=1 Tax=Cyanothece sp. (strain PCC 7425 / ATCC 29141) TaxID=395961 RepID=B8HZ91_CYAP4
MGKWRWRGTFLLSIISAIAPLWAQCAEYQGKNIDGLVFSGQAFSYSLGGLYSAQVKFEQNDAILKFVNGSQLRLRLDSETITDLSNIQGYVKPPLFSLGLYTPDITDYSPLMRSPSPYAGQWRIDINSPSVNPSLFPAKHE